MNTESPWHAGETRLQAQAGVAERMDVVGRKVIRSEMPDQHRQFYQQLPFMLLGAVDNRGNPGPACSKGLSVSLTRQPLGCCSSTACQPPKTLPS